MLKVYCVIFLSFTFLSLYSVPPFSGSMFRPFFLSPFKYSTRKTQWGQSARVTEIQLNLLREEEIPCNTEGYSLSFRRKCYFPAPPNLNLKKVVRLRAEDCLKFPYQIISREDLELHFNNLSAIDQSAFSLLVILTFLLTACMWHLPVSQYSWWSENAPFITSKFHLLTDG